MGRDGGWDMPKTLCGLLGGLLLVLATGCGSAKEPAPNPFFEEWKVRAENATAAVPGARRHQVDLSRKALDPAAESATREVRETVRPLPTIPVTLRMNAVELPVLLRALARAAGQNIMINERVAGKVQINIENVPWDQAFRAVLRTHGLAYAWEGEVLRIMTAQDQEEDLKRESQRRELELVKPMVTRIVRIDYGDPANLKENLQGFLARHKDDKARGSIMVDKHSNSLIIQAIPEDIDRIVPLIEALDQPTPQVLIEAHIVEANQDTSRELGVSWGADGGPLYTRGVGNGLVSEGVVNYDLSSDSSLKQLDLVNQNKSFGQLGLSFSKLFGSPFEIIDARLLALEEEGKLNILSRPSITTLDNQKAIFESGRDVPYQTVVDNDVNIEWKKASLILEVTPHVIDGSSLKLQIKTTKDEIDFSNAVNGNPAIITKRAETNVILQDGQTTVIGGLSKQTGSDSEGGIPGLKDAPLLGNLFRTEGGAKNKEEILIFITPRILKSRASEVEGSPPTPASGEGSIRDAAVP